MEVVLTQLVGVNLDQQLLTVSYPAEVPTPIHVELSNYFTKPIPKLTRPAWAGFKTAEEGRAKICKILWQKLKNKSNIEKHIMNKVRTLLEQFYNSFRTLRPF